MKRMKKYVINPSSEQISPSSSRPNQGVLNGGLVEAENENLRIFDPKPSSKPEPKSELPLTPDNLVYENVDSAKSSDYYEEIKFTNQNKRENEQKNNEDYEEVLVINGGGRESVKFSYNQRKGSSDYENVQQSQSRGSAGPRRSRNEVESTFSIARRFPSIRFKGPSRAKKVPSDVFPRTSGQNIPISFGSLEDLYSKPDKDTNSSHKKKSNTILPILPPEDHEHLRPSAKEEEDNKSGAIYSSLKSPSLSTLTNSITNKSTRYMTNLGFGFSKKRSEDKKNVESRRNEFKLCPCLPQLTEFRGQKESGSAEAVNLRKKLCSTSFLCGLIAVSLIIVIVASAVLIYHYVSGDVISVHGAAVNATSQGELHNPYGYVTAKPKLAKPLVPDNYYAKSIPYNQMGWSSWTSWSKCSLECLKGESQARTRFCLDEEGEKLKDLKPCLQMGPGLNVEIRLCSCNQSYFQSSKRDLQTVRYCDDCLSGEVCLALSQELLPICKLKLDPLDPTGCAGLCRMEDQICQRLDVDAFRCQNLIDAPKSCNISKEFTCHDGSCVDVNKVCNGITDCKFGEDELNCNYIKPRQARLLRQKNKGLSAQCQANEFFCEDDDMTCLNEELFCDGNFDCTDHSDEPFGCI